MEEIVERSAQESFFVPENVYASSVRISYYDSLLSVAPEYEQMALKFQKAEAQLYGGQTEEAIQTLEELWHIHNTQLLIPGLSDYDEDRIDDLLALANLRLGEQQNCIINHSAASCILPIQEPGFHQLPQGSTQAITYLEEILQNNPRDLHSRWLLNVAYMTLGKYPEEVPEEWLIPQEAFASDYPLKEFQDVAPQLGLDVNSLSGGCVVDDFNNDNYLDMMVSSWFADDPLRLFLNQGDGSFEEVSVSSGLNAAKGGLNMVQADYNNDGWLDVLVLRGAWLGPLGKHPNSLLRNNGIGPDGKLSFTDVTIEAGLLSYHPTQTATWNDYNQDGWLDLFIGNESSSQDDIHPSELFLSRRDGTFKEVAEKAGVKVSQGEEWYYIKGVTSGDYNNDGKPDLFVSALDDQKTNLLFQNMGTNEEGIPVFEEVSQQAGLGEKISSFPTWFFDYDNDGWLDLFVAGYYREAQVISSITHDITAEYLEIPHTAETARLYKNNQVDPYGKVTFTDVSKEVRLDKISYAMGANYGDLDNDGWLDFYLSTGEVNFASIIPNRMFRNAEGKVFQDVTTAGGFGHLQKGHAVSFADWDNDGDQDIYTVMGGAYEGDNFQNILFQNPYQVSPHQNGTPHATNHWITIKLVGKETNRSAIGSKLILTITEGQKQRQIVREINSGGSFGCSPLRAQIGVGKAEQIDTLTIEWGRGSMQKFYSLTVDQFIQIKEGKDKITQLNMNSIQPSFIKQQHHTAHVK